MINRKVMKSAPLMVSWKPEGIPQSGMKKKTKKKTDIQNQSEPYWFLKGDTYYAASNNKAELPSGMFKVMSTMDGYGLQIKEAASDKIFIGEDNLTQKILDNMKTFWSSREAYKEFGQVYKRGILLHGAPGCGKTTIIALLSKIVVEEMNGIVIYVHPGSIDGALDCIEHINETYPNRNILCIYEDVDAYMTKGAVENFLSHILDGHHEVEGVVHVATTNTIQLIPEKFKDRPSRFDFLIEVPKPNARDREGYIKFFLEGKDVECDIDALVRDTEGMTIAHVKELLISQFVLKLDYDESLQRIKKLAQSESKVGFK